MDALQDVLQHVGKSSAVVFQHPPEVMTVTAWTLLLMSRSEAGPVNLPIKRGAGSSLVPIFPYRGDYKTFAACKTWKRTQTYSNCEVQPPSWHPWVAHGQQEAKCTRKIQGYDGCDVAAQRDPETRASGGFGRVKSSFCN